MEVVLTLLGAADLAATLWLIRLLKPAEAAAPSPPQVRRAPKTASGKRKPVVHTDMDAYHAELKAMEREERPLE